MNSARIILKPLKGYPLISGFSEYITCVSICLLRRVNGRAAQWPKAKAMSFHIKMNRASLMTRICHLERYDEQQIQNGLGGILY